MNMERVLTQLELNDLKYLKNKLLAAIERHRECTKCNGMGLLTETYRDFGIEYEYVNPCACREAEEQAFMQLKDKLEYCGRNFREGEWITDEMVRKY